MSLPRRLASLALTCVLLAAIPALASCSGATRRRPVDEAAYLRFRASFVERLLANDKASQRASIGPAKEANAELLRLAAADDALAVEAEAIAPPERWRTDDELLARAARSFAAGMRGFAAVALRPTRDDTAAVDAATKDVVEGQRAFEAAQRMYVDLMKGTSG